MSDDAVLESVKTLNQIAADTMVLRDLYKKHHWQVSGTTFYQLHLLFDKHYGEQSALVDSLAERIQTLSGITVAMAHDVAEMTSLQRPPRGREAVPVQMSRLLDACALARKSGQIKLRCADAILIFVLTGSLQSRVT